MVLHVWTKASWRPVQNYLANQSALHQDTQAIIDCGERNFWHALFGPLKDFFSSWMIMTFQQNVVNALTLFCEPKTAGGQALGEVMANSNARKRCFYEEK